jgi:DnaD/phage-associated family protein
MADFRNIFTRTWNDKWFVTLEIDEKLLFIYLFSNERASVCGMYELPLRTIVFETGINKDRVLQILDRLQKDKKVYYSEEVIYIVNFQKYNNSGNSSKVKIRARKDVEMTPDGEIKKMYCKVNKIPYPKSNIPYPEKFHDRDTDRDTEKDRDTDRDTEPSAADIYKAYQNNIGELSGIISEKIDADIKEYTAQWVMEAIEKATVQEKRSLGYVEGILKGWKRDGKGTPKPEKSNKRTIKIDGQEIEVGMP